MTRVTATLTCAICDNFETSPTWVVTHPCTHIFHEECIRRWTETRIDERRSAKHDTCPLCREKLTRPSSKSSINNMNKHRWSRFGKLHFNSLTINEGSSSSPTRPLRRKRRISDACGNESDNGGIQPLQAAALARPGVLADSDAEDADAAQEQAEATESESDEDNARPARAAHPARLRGADQPARDHVDADAHEQARLLDDLRTALDTQTGKYLQLSRETRAKDAEIQALQDAQRQWQESEGAALEQRISDLQSVARNKDADLKKHIDDLKALKKTHAKEVEARTQASEQMNRMNTELTACKIKHAETKTAIRDFESKYTDLSDNYGDLQTRFDRMQRGFNAMQSAHEKLGSRLAQKKDRTAALEQENKDLREQLLNFKGASSGVDPSTATASKARVTSRFFGAVTTSKTNNAENAQDAVDKSQSFEESLLITGRDAFHLDDDDDDCIMLESTAAQDIDDFDAQMLPPSNRHLQLTGVSAVSKNKQASSMRGSAKWAAMALKGSCHALGDKKRAKPKFS